MTVVVDASVAVKWSKQERGSAAAEALLLGDAALIAPDLIIAETLNADWKNLRSGNLTPEQASRTIPRLLLVLTECVPVAELASAAFFLARTLDHPVYDCFYLALAEQRGGVLVTADRRLLQRLAGTPWHALARDLMAG